MKTAISQVKNTLNRINGRFDIAEENISGLKDVTLETIQNRKKKKQFKKIERASLRYGIVLGNLQFMLLESSRKKRGVEKTLRK